MFKVQGEKPMENDKPIDLKKKIQVIKYGLEIESGKLRISLLKSL